MQAINPLADWSGRIGDSYFKRNPVTDDGLARRKAWLCKVLCHLDPPPRTILEIGAGAGDNLIVLDELLPGAELFATEPNAAARGAMMEALPNVSAFSHSAQGLSLGDGTMDLVFTVCCLIHVPADELNQALSEIYRISRKWIVISEYFAARPEHIDWRGSHIWKCDFGSALMDLFPTVKPVACNFEWKPLTGLDHCTWWVFRK